MLATVMIQPRLSQQVGSVPYKTVEVPSHTFAPAELLHLPASQLLHLLPPAELRHFDRLLSGARFQLRQKH